MIVFVEKMFLSILVLAVVWAIFRFTERRFERCRHQNHIAYAPEKTAVYHDEIRELESSTPQIWQHDQLGRSFFFNPKASVRMYSLQRILPQ